MDDLKTLLEEIRACQVCAAHLPLGPRPVVQASPSAKILIIGQAPGTRVHETGVPWNDPSGDRLRNWMALDQDVFYDQNRIALMPMGFCYPGRAQTRGGKSGGDNPPRPECAPLWHERLLAHMTQVELTLLVGGFAQKHYLRPRRYNTMTETVQNWSDFVPHTLPLPHPSWRATGWLKKNPWFELEVVPVLRDRVAILSALNNTN